MARRRIDSFAPQGYWTRILPVKFTLTLDDTFSPFPETSNLIRKLSRTPNTLSEDIADTTLKISYAKSILTRQSKNFL